jgi:hypothetical protein
MQQISRLRYAPLEMTRYAASLEMTRYAARHCVCYLSGLLHGSFLAARNDGVASVIASPHAMLGAGSAKQSRKKIKKICN